MIPARLAGGPGILGRKVLQHLLTAPVTSAASKAMGAKRLRGIATLAVSTSISSVSMIIM